MYNRKTGQMETRDHVWVNIGHKRERFEETADRRSATLKQVSNNPTEGQVREAKLKVASFVPWPIVDGQRVT